MREEREPKVLSKMEGIYGRKRYLGEVRKFEECNGLSRGIRERDKRRRSMMIRKEKGKVESS